MSRAIITRRFFRRAASRAALFGVLALSFGVSGRTASAGTAHEPLWLETSSGERELDVEVAETEQEKASGLMFRSSLPDNRGMLFPTDVPREASMWMRNTYIPLDMVFIKPDGTVRRIEVMTEPLSERIISSRGPVSAVLELAGGAADRLGLKPGDKIRHRLFGNSR